MRPKQYYWTRKLELDLINFVRQREFIWKPIGNTNHHIRQKYKAYAEFAANVGHGFTARSVRARWVNIRSTFNHNLNRIKKSREKSNSTADVYVPCWPLWKPLQFLCEASKKHSSTETLEDFKHQYMVKEEIQSELDTHDATDIIEIRQRGQRTDRPRRKNNITVTPKDRSKSIKCKRLLDDLIKSMKPLTNIAENNVGTDHSYWFFGKHVTERLNCMSREDSLCAARDILQLLHKWPELSNGGSPMT